MKGSRALWYYIKNYKFNSLFIKSFSLIIVLIVLPLSIISFLFYSNVNNMMKEEISTSNMGSLYRIRDVSDTVIKEVDMLATNATLQNSIQMFMISANYGSILSDTKNRINEFIKTYTLVYKYIDSIYIYSEKNDMVLSNRENTDFNSFHDKSWHEIYKLKKDNTVSIYPRSKNNAYPYFITVIKPVAFGNQNVIGCVVINISTRHFGDLIANSDNPVNQNILIAHGEGSVMHYDKDDLILSKIEDLGYVKLIERKGSGFSGQMDIENVPSIVSVLDSSYYNYKYISIIPLSRYKERIDNMVSFMIILIISALLIGGVIAFIISLKSFQPIRSIISAIDDPGSWKDSKFYGNNKNSDELKYIINNVTQTIESKKEMEKELERRLILLDQATFMALQTQISPHFLYNTLETINCLAVKTVGKKNIISSAILSLAQLFRLGLETENYLISVGQEIEHAKRYIEILKLRYEDMFDVAWDIDESILNMKIIKICLQPIIENAIYHGIKPINKNRITGIVSIKGYMTNSLNKNIEKNESNQNVIFEITDNGVGMSLEEIDALNISLNEKYSKNSKHIGIRNVNQRIKLIFGENYGVKVESEIGVGTVVTIIVPSIV